MSGDQNVPTENPPAPKPNTPAASGPSVVTTVPTPALTTVLSEKPKTGHDFGVIVHFTQDLTTPGGKHIQKGALMLSLTEPLFAESVQEFISSHYLDVLDAQAAPSQPLYDLLIRRWQNIDLTEADADAIRALTDATDQYAKNVKPQYEVPCLRLVRGWGQISPSRRSQTCFAYAIMHNTQTPTEYRTDAQGPERTYRSMTVDTPEFVGGKGILIKAEKKNTLVARPELKLPSEPEEDAVRAAPRGGTSDFHVDGFIHPSTTTLVHPNWCRLIHIILHKLYSFFTYKDNYKVYVECVHRMIPNDPPTLENIPEHEGVQILCSLFYAVDALSQVAGVTDFNNMSPSSYTKLLTLIKCSRKLKDFATLHVELEPGYEADFQELRRLEEVVILINWVCGLLDHKPKTRGAYKRRTFTAYSRRWSSTYLHQLLWKVPGHGHTGKGGKKFNGVYATGGIDVRSFNLSVLLWKKLTTGEFPEIVTTADFHNAVVLAPKKWVMPANVHDWIHSVISGSLTDTIMLLSLRAKREDVQDMPTNGIFQILGGSHAYGPYLTEPLQNFIVAKSTEAQAVKGNIFIPRSFLDKYAILYEPLALPPTSECFEL